jgi:hypothetical protein
VATLSPSPGRAVAGADFLMQMQPPLHRRLETERDRAGAAARRPCSPRHAARGLDARMAERDIGDGAAVVAEHALHLDVGVGGERRHIPASPPIEQPEEDGELLPLDLVGGQRKLTREERERRERGGRRCRAAGPCSAERRRWQQHPLLLMTARRGGGQTGEDAGASLVPMRNHRSSTRPPSHPHQGERRRRGEGRERAPSAAAWGPSLLQSQLELGHP